MGFAFQLLRAWGISLLVLAFTRTAAAVYTSTGIFVCLIAYVTFKNLTEKANPPRSTPVPAGKTRICVAGPEVAAPTAKAHRLAHAIATAHPDKYETWYYWTSYAFDDFTKKKFDDVPFPAHLKGHSTRPFCWLERGPKNEIEPLGGSDGLSKWALENFQTPAVRKEASTAYSVMDYLKGRSSHLSVGKATCEA